MIPSDLSWGPDEPRVRKRKVTRNSQGTTEDREGLRLNTSLRKLYTPMEIMAIVNNGLSPGLGLGFAPKNLKSVLS